MGTKMSSSSGIQMKANNDLAGNAYLSDPSNSQARQTLSRPMTNSAKSRSRRTGPHISPFGGGDRINERDENHGVNQSARLMRQQFRQKCQEAMAKDRSRDRERKLQKARESGSSAPNSDTDVATTYATESSLSSEFGNESDFDHMNEEEEAIRRIMTAEYRKMLKEQEQEGNIEVGWLGPDEVAWLEEEMRKEDQVEQIQSMEPPLDMVDEDEELCDMYEHAQSQARGSTMNVDPILQDDEDFSWIQEVDCTIWDRHPDESENMDVTV